MSLLTNVQRSVFCSGAGTTWTRYVNLTLAGGIDIDEAATELEITVPSGDILTIDGAGSVAFGEDDDGIDVVFYGATASAKVTWDESEDALVPSGTASIKNLGVITDPGDGEAIPVTHSGYCALVTAGAETRTLAAPSFIGQQLLLYMKTDGGDCVVTCATTVNEAGNNTITFDNEGEAVWMIAVEDGSDLRWRCATADGAGLSTV